MAHVKPINRVTRHYPEHEHQKALVAWAQLNLRKYPELELLHAIPNGGHRLIQVATKLKAEGTKAGVPDLCLPVARRGYHGLYIELKAYTNKPTDIQEWWLRKLSEQGYLTYVAYGWDSARELLVEYLAKPRRRTRTLG